jgi:hypothetical protein
MIGGGFSTTAAVIIHGVAAVNNPVVIMHDLYAVDEHQTRAEARPAPGAAPGPPVAPPR